MNIKNSLRLLGILAAIIFYTGCDESSDSSDSGSLDLIGIWRYQVSWQNNTATTIVESGEDGQIKNNTDSTTGDLKLKLYFTSSIYEPGEGIYGYVMAEKSFGSLESNYYKYNITFSDSTSLPPVGAYFVTLVLVEYNTDQYYIQDYINFDDMIIIYNTSYYEYEYYYYYY